MASIQIATPFNLPLDFETAELHKRIFAYLVDLFIMALYAWIVGNFVYDTSVTGVGQAIYGWSILFISVPILFYSLVSEVFMHGQTLGKKIFDLRVMSLHGGEPSLSQYLLRWIFRFFEWPLVFGVVIPGLGVLLQVFSMAIPGIVVVITIAVTAKGQRLGDLAAATILVNTRVNTSINDTVFQEVDQHNYKVMFPEVMRLSDRDINTIKSVLSNSYNRKHQDLAYRTAARVQSALKIQTQLEPIIFLEKLLQDYNYLATKE
ncbi:MAG: RDD family protein [Bacteroidota bacterium]|nr:RDD family protein [Bacteroidota bacterium]